MAAEHRKHIRISNHAMQRLRERVGSYGDYQSWEHYVRSARYNGRDELMMDDFERKWFNTHISRQYRYSRIRLFDSYAFIFRGMNSKAWTLITVIPIFETTIEKEDSTDCLLD